MWSDPVDKFVLYALEQMSSFTFSGRAESVVPIFRKPIEFAAKPTKTCDLVTELGDFGMQQSAHLETRRTTPVASGKHCP